MDVCVMACCQCSASADGCPRLRKVRGPWFRNKYIEADYAADLYNPMNNENTERS